MKNYKLLLGAVLLFCACTPKAHITATLQGAPERKVEVRLLNLNSWKVLDTVSTGKNAAFSYSVNVQKGKPEFVYLFYGETKIASLLLKAGDRVKVEADTLGAFTVEGSEDSRLLQESEQSFAAFASNMVVLSSQEDKGSEMAKLFIDHYREATRFVLAHPFSLVSVPVLYQNLNEYTPVFNQHSDALIFRSVTDSLKTVYPESPYVKALEAETTRREKAFQLQNRLNNAELADFPELALPGIDGKAVSLSGLDAKVVLLHFWDPASGDQKMFNLDVLMPLYKRWHSRGLEIYAVGVSASKPDWAAVVNAQELPWVNVCDGNGAYSTALGLYGVGELPWTALISSKIGVRSVKGEKGLEAELKKLLL